MLSSSTSLANELYQKVCARCHASSLHGAPQPGSARLQERYTGQGYDKLLKSVIQGQKKMPKRGGCFSCSDADLEQALQHMLKGV